MRKYIKRQMAELLDTMSDAVEMLPEAAGENNRSQFTNLLADQQERDSRKESRLEILQELMACK